MQHNSIPLAEPGGLPLIGLYHVFVFISVNQGLIRFTVSDTVSSSLILFELEPLHPAIRNKPHLLR